MGHAPVLLQTEMSQSKSLSDLNMDAYLLAHAQPPATHPADATYPDLPSQRVPCHARLPNAQARQMQQSLFSSCVSGETAILPLELHFGVPVSTHRNTPRNPKTWQQVWGLV